MVRLLFPILFSFFLINAQNTELNSILQVSYYGQLKIGDKSSHNENSVLLIGKNFSYYSSLGSISDDVKDFNVDYSNIESNTSYISERILYNNKSKKTDVFEVNVEAKVRFQKEIVFDWNLVNETKKINGVLCQKATTRKFGRDWIAYFSKEYNFNFGPYKFHGLPGLIFEVYDTKNEYTFTLKEIKKAKYSINMDWKNYKLVDEKKFLEIRETMRYTLASYPIIDDPQEKKEIEESLLRIKKSQNNPIELNPFD